MKVLGENVFINSHKLISIWAMFIYSIRLQYVCWSNFTIKTIKYILNEIMKESFRPDNSIKSLAIEMSFISCNGSKASLLNIVLVFLRCFISTRTGFYFLAVFKSFYEHTLDVIFIFFFKSRHKHWINIYLLAMPQTINHDYFLYRGLAPSIILNICIDV